MEYLFSNKICLFFQEENWTLYQIFIFFKTFDWNGFQKNFLNHNVYDLQGLGFIFYEINPQTTSRSEICGIIFLKAQELSMQLQNFPHTSKAREAIKLLNQQQQLPENLRKLTQMQILNNKNSGGWESFVINAFGICVVVVTLIVVGKYVWDVLQVSGYSVNTSNMNKTQHLSVENINHFDPILPNPVIPDVALSTSKFLETFIDYGNGRKRIPLSFVKDSDHFYKNTLMPLIQEMTDRGMFNN